LRALSVSFLNCVARLCPYAIQLLRCHPRRGKSYDSPANRACQETSVTGTSATPANG